MSAFGGLILTNRGRILQAKAQTGIGLKYTRIALGDGTLGNSQIIELNALKHEVISLPIGKLKVNSGTAIIGTVLNNNNLASGFYFREIGVFATDPDVGEILYCYGNAGNLAEYIPAGGGADVVEKAIDIQVLTGNAPNVSAIIDQSLIFETPEGAQQKADEALTLATAYTNEKLANIDLSAFATKQELQTADNKLETHKADYVAHPANGGTTAGTASAYTCNSSPNPTALVDKIGIVIAPHVDSGVNPTLKWGALTAYPMIKANGSPANLKKDGIYTFRYSGPKSAFILQGEGGSGNLQPNQALAGFTFTNDNGEQVGLGDANLVPENIRKDVSIFGILGAMAQGKQIQTGTVTITMFGGTGSTSILTTTPGTVTGLGFVPGTIYLHVNGFSFNQRSDTLSAISGLVANGKGVNMGLYAPDSSIISPSYGVTAQMNSDGSVTNIVFNLSLGGALMKINKQFSGQVTFPYVIVEA